MPRLQALLAACLLSLVACSTDSFQAVASVDTVNVSVNCYADSTVAVALSPWVRHVGPGGTIDWVMAQPNAGTVDSFFVERKPKGSGRWMYADRSRAGRPGDPGRSGPMKGTARKGDRGHYNLVAWCRPDDGPVTFKVIIDPDVVVD